MTSWRMRRFLESLRGFAEGVVMLVMFIAVIIAALYLHDTKTPSAIVWGAFVAPMVLFTLAWSWLRGDAQTAADFGKPGRTLFEKLRNGCFNLALIFVVVDIFYLLIALVMLLSSGSSCPSCEAAARFVP